MMPQRTELTQVLLGLEPFVLVEVAGATKDDDGDVDVTFRVRRGGGIATENDLVMLLAQVLQQLREQGSAPEVFALIDDDARERLAGGA